MDIARNLFNSQFGAVGQGQFWQQFRDFWTNEMRTDDFVISAVDHDLYKALSF